MIRKTLLLAALAWLLSGCSTKFFASGGPCDPSAAQMLTQVIFDFEDLYLQRLTKPYASSADRTSQELRRADIQETRDPLDDLLVHCQLPPWDGGALCAFGEKLNTLASLHLAKAIQRDKPWSIGAARSRFNQLLAAYKKIWAVENYRGCRMVVNYERSN